MTHVSSPEPGARVPARLKTVLLSGSKYQRCSRGGTQSFPRTRWRPPAPRPAYSAGPRQPRRQALSPGSPRRCQRMPGAPQGAWRRTRPRRRARPAPSRNRAAPGRTDPDPGYAPRSAGSSPGHRPGHLHRHHLHHPRSARPSNLGTGSPPAARPAAGGAGRLPCHPVPSE